MRIFDLNSAVSIEEQAELIRLFSACVENNASDLHIVAGRPPMIRIAGELKDVENRKLKPTDVAGMINCILTEEQKHYLDKHKDLDFAFSIPGICRFRGNIHYQRGSMAAAFRVLPLAIPSMKELGVPVTVLTQLARRRSGLVLVTGQTGSGKSTTLASMVNLINSERGCHIITVEDPIEHLHQHKMSLVEQRELHDDTLSFASALRHILRQDPDVILVGEMRDLETCSAAVTAAETGHLVLSSLHTKDAVQTVDRIIDIFPSHQQNQIRSQLSGALEGIICQRLLPHAKEQRLVLAYEVMMATDAIRALIREGKTHMIPTTIESSAKYGMVSMDRSLMNLFSQGMISKETLMRNCIKPDNIKTLIAQKK